MKTENITQSINKEIDILYTHILDAGVNHKDGISGKLLQESINDVLPTNKHLKVDGIIGSETRGKIKYIVNNKQLKDLNKRFKKKRIEYILNNTHPNFRQGILKRVNRIFERIYGNGEYY